MSCFALLKLVKKNSMRVNDQNNNDDIVQVYYFITQVGLQQFSTSKHTRHKTNSLLSLQLYDVSQMYSSI